MERNGKKQTVVVIGAGLTGLTTAYWLRRSGIDVHVIERQQRIGGQIQTHRHGDFVFESGPTTGSISTPEVAELMADLEVQSHGKCVLETAPDAAKRRLIWKGDRFHALPSGLVSAIKTPLFTPLDKLRILGEPWRKRGTNPDETIGELTMRRLGKSFLDYAVNPFISGVYAGDPNMLVTRYAAPKLYQLEANYGSFVRGAIKKSKQPKSEREKLATKKVFSARGGLSNIIEAEANFIGNENITLGAQEVRVGPTESGWETTYLDADNRLCTIFSQEVVTTCGAYELPQLLPFLSAEELSPITSLKYSPVMEVNVGANNTYGGDYCAFGALVPTLERRRILGILFPSACFTQRAPQSGALFAFFIGGIRHPEMLDLNDEEVEKLVTEEWHTMLGFPAQAAPDLIHISRHQRAIPQYEASTGARLEAVSSIERTHTGLTIGGNLRDGIGMGNRITQAANFAKQIIQRYHEAKL